MKNLLKRYNNWPLFFLVVILCILGFRKYIFPRTPNSFANSDSSFMVVCFNPTYYNALLPWFSLEQKIKKYKKIKVLHKKQINATKLQYQMRHNFGDVWITSLDNAAKAWENGADFKILMIMGWKKWMLISTLPKEKIFDPQEKIIYYPQYTNSGVKVLENMTGPDKLNIKFVPINIHILMDKLLKKEIDTALLQTPLATFILMQKKEEFVTIQTLENLYTENSGLLIKLPWTVLSVRKKWAEKNPDIIKLILTEQQKETYRINVAPIHEVVNLWPQNFYQDISPDIIQEMLAHEKLLTLPAYKEEDKIKFLLQILLPNLKYDAKMIWQKNDLAIAERRAEANADTKTKE